MVLSAFLGAGRVVCSKKSGFADGITFHINQSLLFLCAAFSVFIYNPKALVNITYFTVLYAVAFGTAAFFAQWCYTKALKSGTTAICTMIYSFGFILPTVSGTVFWNEPFGILSAMGLFFAISAIVISSFCSEKKLDSKIKIRGFIVSGLIAALCSGGLGILQKMHQSSDDAVNVEAFLILSFIFASLISVNILPFCNKGDFKINFKSFAFSGTAGVCFGLVSLFNTLLAGRLPTSIVFPTLNIGVMMMSFVAGCIVFKEKLAKSQFIACVFGCVSVILLSFEK